MSITATAPPLTAAQHRAAAKRADRAAILAPTRAASRGYRDAARDHRLAALLAAYDLPGTT